MTLAAQTRVVAVLAAAALLFGSAPHALTATSELRVLSSNGVKGVLEELLPKYEKAIGRPLAIQFGTSASIRQRIDAGETIDVVIVTTDVLAELVEAGKVVATSTTGLGRSGIGVGIRAGGRRFDITTPEALEQSFASARSLTYARDGASRVHIVSMFDRLGIAGQMQSKTILEQGSVRAAAKVVAGEVELLITLVSEILPVEGIELLGPLPAEFQNYISFAGGIGANATDPEGAKMLIELLSGPDVAPTFEAHGIELVAAP